MRLACGDVVVELVWATQSSLSFSIRRDSLGDFWVEDLLYLHGDERSQSIPQAIHLNSEASVKAFRIADYTAKWISSG